MEPALFAFADAQDALMDGAAGVVANGSNYGPHSPIGSNEMDSLVIKIRCCRRRRRRRRQSIEIKLT